MRLPAVAFAALFACGVVFGQAHWLAQRVAAHLFLRDVPARLPWGYDYEIELSGAEYERLAGSSARRIARQFHRGA